MASASRPADELRTIDGMAMAAGTYAAIAWPRRPATPALTRCDAGAQRRASKPTDDDWRIWTSFANQYYAADPEQLGATEFTEPTFDGDGVRLQFRLLEGYSTLMGHIATDRHPLRRLCVALSGAGTA